MFSVFKANNIVDLLIEKKNSVKGRVVSIYKGNNFAQNKLVILEGLPYSYT